MKEDRVFVMKEGSVFAMKEDSVFIRRFLLVLGLAVLIIVMLAARADANSGLRLSRSRVTLKAGKAVTLKLKGASGKVKWSVSGKKLVTIRARGSAGHKAVIKMGKKAGTCSVRVKAGKKAGTCYVKVKAGGKTVKCKVIVKAKGKSSDPEDDFQEKELSGTSKDVTASYKAGAVTGKETDATFRKAYMDVSLSMLKFLAASDSGKSSSIAGSDSGKNSSISGSDTGKSSNILISPESILTAMAMTECGAGGNTLAEMESAFGDLNSDDLNRYLYTLNRRLASSEKIKYHIANSLWYKDNKSDISVKEEFIQKNVDFFGASVFEAPFSDETAADINNWVYNNTRGMIPGIIDKLNPDTVMILLNAIAFQGEWADKYYDGQISDKPFYNEDGTVQKKVPMLEGMESTYVKVGSADGFIKPYAGNEAAFLGLETPDGMTADEFLQSLTADDFIRAYDARSSAYDVHTVMPEFKYDYGESLVDTLKSLGIRDAFDDDLADFTGITPPDQPLVISDVLHKTHIELDRNGTKAAAVTAVIIDKASSAPVQKPTVDVTLDRPFVYAIIDTESGLPLFIGVLRTV